VAREGVVEAAQRAECRVFLGAAVERAGQRVRHAFRARPVDRDFALAGERSVGEDVERHAEMRRSGYDVLADRTLARRVVAVRVVGADAFCVAVELALDLERAAVGEHVFERGRETRARPRPPALAFAAAQAVERCDERRRQRRFARFVRTGDDVDARREFERAIDEPPEALDAQTPQDHGAMSVPSNAASA
jgi:hypothetical protein